MLSASLSSRPNGGWFFQPKAPPDRRLALFAPRIRLGDSTVEYNEDFRLFITTKLPNPHYAPEICVQAGVMLVLVGFS